MSYFATARRGIYFALLTLIFAEVVYTFFRYTQTFGGSDGIQGAARAELLPGDFAIDTPLRNYYLVLVYLGLAYLACRVLVTSHFGRVLVAIRENEDRARFLGYNVQRYKMAVCMISALAHRSRRRPLPGPLGVRDARPHAVDRLGRVHHHGHDRRARDARRAPSSAARSSSCCRRRSRRTWTGTSS